MTPATQLPESGTELPIGVWQIVTDALGFESVYSSDEDGCRGDLIAHIFGDGARLIAAAPDLYRELDELADWLHDIQRSIEGEFDMGDILSGPRAALAKARTQLPSEVAK